jgi:hypothetical protein
MWERIETKSQLKAFCSESENNVGVSKDGKLYVYDLKKNQAKQLSIEEAAEVLNVNLDMMSDIVRTGGTYQPKIMKKKEPDNDLIEDDDIVDDEEFEDEPEQPEEDNQEEIQEEIQEETLVEEPHGEPHEEDNFIEETIEKLEDIVISVGDLIEKIKQK